MHRLGIRLGLVKSQGNEKRPSAETRASPVYTTKQ